MKILSAEDDKVIREIIEESLTDAGHTVEMVEDGDLALARLREGGEYDVLITDNQMPRMRGLVLLKTLRSDARFKTLPIIVFSSDTDIAKIVAELGGIYADKSDFGNLHNALKKALP